MAPFLLGAVSALLAWQATQATISGTVRDGESGRAMAGAIVTLTDLAHVAITDPNGRYVLRNVPPGPQHVTIRTLGYAQRTLHALVPQTGELEINVSLRAQPIALKRIEVHSRMPMRGLDGEDQGAFPDRTMSIAAVRAHPMLSEPDVFQALSGSEVAIRPESPSGVHIRGGSADQTAFLLDGVPVFSPYHAAGVFSAWNPDALSQVQLVTASPGGPATLSGAIGALTRTPGSRLQAQGGVSTTQARVTLDGPIGSAGAGYLLSLRSGFPGIIAPRREPSYLHGKTLDWLAKVEAPALGGRVQLLGYLSENVIRAAAAADSTASRVARHGFEWQSASVGAQWRRQYAAAALRVQAWSATGDSDAAWAPDRREAKALSALRTDLGLVVEAQRGHDAASTTAGLRLERSTTAYQVTSDSANNAAWDRTARTPVTTAYLSHTRAIDQRIVLDAGGSAATLAGAVHFSPRAELRWLASDQLTLSLSAARLHQFAQSLRNPESIVGSIFPVDLFAGAGENGVPVSRSDQAILAADYRPAAGVRISGQGYSRRLQGLLLVAPRAGDPFTTNAFAIGNGTVRGLSLDAAVTSARLGFIASYGWQRLQLTHADSSYVPEHGATHRIETGVVLYPRPTVSLNAGATAAFGRRATAASGALEWEACSLRDQGCEFGGSPLYDSSALGGVKLPAYLRLDIGARKHWHIEVGGRDASIALFGTLTNVFARNNVLGYSIDPETGRPASVLMRPFAPLVIGLDWRF